jgi:hypothetical protein
MWFSASDSLTYFVGGLLPLARDLDIVVGAADGAGGLHEDHGLGRHLHPALGCVVRVVEADADHLADLADAGTQARAAVDQRQAVQAEAGQLLQAAGAQALACDILDMALERADAALPIHDPGLLLALGPIAHELHSRLPPMLTAVRERRK